MESGNSPGIIRREYLELAPAEDAAKWFVISPSVCKAAELEQYAKELLDAQSIRKRAA